MSTEKAYDQWSSIYDTNENKTRDLEAVAVRKMLEPVQFRYVLEIGAGTGKNTVWYLGFANRIVAVDLSAEMLAKAKEKVEALGNPECISEFVQADVTQSWSFGEACFDLVTFSLMLEHIEHLEPIFEEASRALMRGGHVYVGELHPFKQYLGSKAKFQTETGEVVVNCFNHHVSDFVRAAQKHGLQLIDLQEFFDVEGEGVPRVLGLLFRKE